MYPFCAEGRWILNLNNQDLEIINAATGATWIDASTNSFPPLSRSLKADPNEHYWLDEECLFLFFSDRTFRIIFLPNKKEITQEFKAILDPVLKQYRIAYFSVSTVMHDFLNCVCYNEDYFSSSLYLVRVELSDKFNL